MPSPGCPAPPEPLFMHPPSHDAGQNGDDDRGQDADPERGGFCW